MGNQNSCFHCGEPSEEQKFCCMGCHMAFALIQGAGLTAVYNQPDRKLLKVAGEISRGFELFDNLDFLEKRAPLQTDGSRSIDLAISGMMCSSCIWLIEKLPFFIPEIISARVDYGMSQVNIRFKNSPHILTRSAEVLSKLGYKLEPQELDLKSSRVPKKEWLRLGITGLSAAGAMHIGLVLIGAHQTDIPSNDARIIGIFAGIVALPALTFGAAPFFRSAISALKLKMLSSDLLVAIAVFLGSIASVINAIKGKTESYFDALTMIIFLLLSGRILVRLSTLRVLARPLWWARKNGNLIAASTLKYNDTFQAKKGDIISVDSKLASPYGWLSLASINGESWPAKVVEGQKIFQGSIAESDIDLIADSEVNNSYLEKLYRSVQEKSWKNISPKYETIFTFIILCLVLSVLVFSNGEKVSVALALLIVTCPCALQLAYPLGITGFKKEALRLGFYLFNAGRSLNWDKVNSIYFDKTGTLTEGMPKLRKIITIDKSKFDDHTLNSFIFQLATESNHPLAKTLAEEYSGKPRSKTEINNIHEIPGTGVSALFDNQEIVLKKSQSEESLGMQTSLFINQKEILRFEFSDSIRSKSKEVLIKLKNMGFNLHLLSGDRLSECQKFASDLGFEFDSIQAEKSPLEKKEFQSKKSALIGDGLNDAEAMQAAGTSLGFSGSAEASLKAADAYLLNKDLQLIPDLISLSKAVAVRIRFNIVISLVYNVITILLVMNGFIGPIICAIFMPLSSLTVLLLSLRRHELNN